MSQESKLEEYKDRRKKIKNNPKIKNPRFSFIYTVNLDGRIRLEPIETPSTVGESSTDFFKNLIAPGGSPDFKYEFPEKHLPHFLDDHFLQKAILGIWNIEYTENVWEKYEENINEYLQSLFDYNIQCDDFSVSKRKFEGVFEDSELDELKKGIIECEKDADNLICFSRGKENESFEARIGKISIPEKKKRLCKNIWESRDTKERKDGEIKITIKLVRSDTDKPYHIPQIKLFATGGLGILLEFELRLSDKDGNLIPKDPENPNDEDGNLIPADIFLKASDCVKLIEYPNLVKNLDIGEYFPKLIDSLKQETGVLNAASFSVCEYIFKKFMEKIDNDNGKKLEIEKISGNENVIENYHAGRYFADKNTKRLNIYPYVGILFIELPKSVSLTGLSDDEIKRRDRGCRLLFALANQTIPFLDNFMEPYTYLKEKDISRGERDSIIIERRGLVAAGSRSPNWDEFLHNAYATLIFCLESLLATIKSVSTLNKDIEKFISEEISRLLKTPEKQKSEKYLRERLEKLEKVLVKVCKARTLSPCEDISSNILPYIRSRVSYEGVKRFKEFTLDDLVDLAHNRLTNYGHFLKAECEEIEVNYNQRRDTAIKELTSMNIFIGSVFIMLSTIALSGLGLWLKFLFFLGAVFLLIKYFKPLSTRIINFFEKQF